MLTVDRVPGVTELEASATAVSMSAGSAAAALRPDWTAADPLGVVAHRPLEAPRLFEEALQDQLVVALQPPGGCFEGHDALGAHREVRREHHPVMPVRLVLPPGLRVRAQVPDGP